MKQTGHWLPSHNAIWKVKDLASPLARRKELSICSPFRMKIHNAFNYKDKEDFIVKIQKPKGMPKTKPLNVR